MGFEAVGRRLDNAVRTVLVAARIVIGMAFLAPVFAVVWYAFATWRDDHLFDERAAAAAAPATVKPRKGEYRGPSVWDVERAIDGPDVESMIE